MHVIQKKKVQIIKKGEIKWSWNIQKATENKYQEKFLFYHYEYKKHFCN